MRTLFLMWAWLLLVTWSCNHASGPPSPKGDEQNVINNQHPAEEETWPNDVPDHHNSRISIYYYGTYRAIIPCADCAGIETEITLLKGDEFERRIRYLGKDDVTWYRDAGPFEWDRTGGIIELATNREPRYYRVGEDVLFQLDHNARPITGELADKYRLFKDEDR